jgi:tetratricopeptide (TPR) repeat protein
VTSRQRDYVISHATKLAIPDLARGARLPEKVVRALLKDARLSQIDAPRYESLPFLYSQLARPETTSVSKADRWLALACGAVALSVYLLTCARDVTGEDCGELVTAAKVLGVAHPPGYPIWCLLGKLFTWIPIGSAVFRIALLSAFAAAGTVSFVALLLLRLTGSRPASAAGALLLAFSVDFWSQAVIPEVYTLNTLFLAAALYLAWRWYEDRTNRLLFGLALTLGLSLTNHSTMGPLLALFLLFVFSIHWNIWREPGLLPLTLLLTALPLALYAYLPIRAEANTIMNWGNPRTFDDVLDHIFRRQYSFEISQAPRTAAGTWAQTLTMIKAAAHQWTPWLGWIALPGAVLAIRRHWRFGLLLGAIFGACTVGFVVLLNFAVTDREKVTAYRIFFIPAWVIASIWMGFTIDAAARLLPRLRLPRPERLAWASCGLAVAPLLLFYRENDKSHYRIVRQYVEAILKTLPPDAMIVPSGDHSSFPLIYVQGVERRRLDVTIVDKYGYTDPTLLWNLPGALKVGVPRIPPADADQRFQDWLIATTDKPVYFTNKRSLAGLPGARWVQEGVLYRVVKEDEKFAPQAGLFERYNLTALADGPRDYTADVIVSEVALTRGAEKAARGDKEGAKADFALSAEATRGIKQGFNNLGSACAENGLLTEAVGYLDQALALDDKYVTALRNLARVYMGLKKWTQAKATIERLRGIDPKDTGVRYLLVDLYRASGQGRLAIFELEKIAKEDPKNPAPLEAAGSLSLEEGDSLGALTYFQRAMSLAPERLDLLDKVQSLLAGGGHGGRDPLDPFGMPGMPRIPKPPDPLEGRNPSGYGTDPFRVRPRR